VQNSRKNNFYLIAGTILLGLISRKIPYVPLFVGDVLYAVMMFFMVRFVFISKKMHWVAVISLGICFFIELSQIYQTPWLNNLRQTLPGRLILGQGFLLSDLLAYFVGTLLVWLVAERFFNIKK